MDVITLIIRIGAAASMLGGAFGGVAFLIYAMKHVKDNAAISEDFNHEEDMGACVEFIMYMVCSIFCFLCAIGGILLTIGVKLYS